MADPTEVLTEVVAESLTAEGGSLTADGSYADSLTSAERGLAGVPADVMHVDRVPVDSHFFDDPRVDTLIMTHSCASVRKRANRPSVSMKGVYRNQTVRSLAEALSPDVPAPVEASPSIYDSFFWWHERSWKLSVNPRLLDGTPFKQEDGAVKSDHITLGAGCTLGVGFLVHYGVTLGEGAVLAPDSFLMKGEGVAPYARWGGNPAQEIDDNRATVQVGGK